MTAMATRAATINMVKFLLVRNASSALISMSINSITISFGEYNTGLWNLQYSGNLFVMRYRKRVLNNPLQGLLRIL